MYRIGFTGSRQGMTSTQRAHVRRCLTLSAHGPAEFHHGDCVGADTEAAGLARTLGYRIIGHPPVNEKLRAFTECDEVWPAAPYLTRNRTIVAVVDVLIACPAERNPQSRSGTWQTIRHAEQVGRRIVLIETDGHIRVTISAEQEVTG